MAENDIENKPAAPAAPRPLRFSTIKPATAPAEPVAPAEPAAAAVPPGMGQIPGIKETIHIRPVGTPATPIAPKATNPQSTAFVPPPAGAQQPRPLPQQPTMATDTSRLLRRTIRMVPNGQGGASAAAPAIPGTDPAPAAQPTMATDTSRLLRRTIRMVPKAAPGTATPAAGAAPASPAASTLKVTPQQGATGLHAMPTIKLGGANAAPANQTVRLPGQGGLHIKPKSDHPTIRLTGKTGGVSVTRPGVSTSNPTIKLQTPTQTPAAAPAPTAGSQTIKMPAPTVEPAPAPAAGEPAATPQNRTIKLPGIRPIHPTTEPAVAPAPTPVDEAPVAKEPQTEAPAVDAPIEKAPEAAKEKTDILAFIFAVAALIAVAFVCVLFAMQLGDKPVAAEVDSTPVASEPATK